MPDTSVTRAGEATAEASLTIVLSGPKSSEPQARTALASQGFEVQRTVDNHGLPDAPTGEPPAQPVAFITVTAEDEQLDAVASCAQTLGYQLRMHHDTPPPHEPSEAEQLAATLADMRREIDELKARVAA